MHAKVQSYATFMVCPGTQRARPVHVPEGEPSPQGTKAEAEEVYRTQGAPGAINRVSCCRLAKDTGSKTQCLGQGGPSPPRSPTAKCRGCTPAPGRRARGPLRKSRNLDAYNLIIERSRQSRSKRMHSVTEQPIIARPPQVRVQGVTDVCGH